MATLRSLDYMHAQRRQHAWSHVPRTSPAQREGQTWSLALREGNALRLSMREREARDLAERTCMACGYVTSPEFSTHADNAHDNLCCGMLDCAWPGDCYSHDDADVLVLVVA